MAGRLPDEGNAGLSRTSLGIRCTSEIQIALIVIEQDETAGECASAPPRALDAVDRHDDARKRVTGPRRQFLHFDVNRQAGFARQPGDQCHIGCFRLPLATDEHRRALGDEGAPPIHPIWGTAPYTPLRYLP